MTDSKSVWKFCFKLFPKKKKNVKKSQCKLSKDLIAAEKAPTVIDAVNDDIREDESDFGGNDIENKAVFLKRHTTVSIDLSDKTLCPINSQQLSKMGSSRDFHRVSSFDIERNLRKLLPITDFEEKEILGEGAFGRAIKVEHIKSGKLFVLKEVLTHSKEDQESIIREVALLRSLKHENILTTIGLVLKDKTICLLTELMHGGSLQAKILNLTEEISLNQKIRFLRDIADGMTFLHGHSIMHRDLTSLNCLLRKDNTVVVCDFGLSKCLKQDKSNYLKDDVDNNNDVVDSTFLDVKLTPRQRNVRSMGDLCYIEKNECDQPVPRVNSGRRSEMKLCRKHTVVGNPFWMAPEMLAGRNYCILVDIYSFGIIGCEVTARVSAHPDFLDRKSKDMSVDFSAFLEKHKDGELLSCPDDLIEIVRKCCDPNYDNRPTFDILLSWLEDMDFDRLIISIRK